MPSLPRTKTVQPGSFNQMGIYYNSANPSAPLQTSSTRYADAIVRTEYRSSVNTPGFHNPNRGRLLPNDFTYELEVDRCPRGRVVTASPFGVKPNQYGYMYTVDEGVWPIGSANLYQNSDNPNNPYMSISSPDAGTLDGQARNAILQKIKGSNVNVAVATAEAGKTIDTVINAAGKIAGAYRDLRRGNLMGAASHFGIRPSRSSRKRFSKAYAKDRTKAVGSAWNEYSYGWVPLVNDVYGAVKELNGAANQGLVQTVRVRKTKETSLNWRKFSGDPKGKYSWLTQQGHARTDVSYSVTFIRRLGAQQDLPRLGITNPAVVAWELVPFSFVVDWFLPIGNWLENLDATLGCDFLSGYTTTYYRSEIIETQTSGDMNSLSGGVRTASITRTRTRRTRLTSFPSIALPSFKNPASIGHLANAMALLTNFIRK